MQSVLRNLIYQQFRENPVAKPAKEDLKNGKKQDPLWERVFKALGKRSAASGRKDLSGRRAVVSIGLGHISFCRIDQ
jgi:hypothetical protein